MYAILLYLEFTIGIKTNMTKKVLIGKKNYTPEIAERIFKLRLLVEDLDLRQLTKKITLNSAYGALLAKGFRWAVEEKLGASTTYSGRAITTHMMNVVAELLTGNSADLIKGYELDKTKVKNVYVASNPAIIYSDTDSVAFDSLIRTNIGNNTIENIFNSADNFKTSGDKEYAFFNELQTFVPINNELQMNEVQWIYRHRVSKERWKITLFSGKEVIVTGDHSVMIERDGILIEICARDINIDTDICISIG
jgi:hypothetical protein